MRVTSAVQRKQKKKDILSIVKGHRGRKNRCVDIANGMSKRTLVAITKSRKLLRRNMRSLWIIRLNALCRQYGMKYSQVITPLKQLLYEQYQCQYDLRDIIYMNEHSDVIKTALTQLNSKHNI